MSVYEHLKAAQYPTSVYDKDTDAKKPLPFEATDYEVSTMFYMQCIIISLEFWCTLLLILFPAQLLPTSASLNKSAFWDPLGTKLSKNEKELVNVSGESYYTIRLDGKNFSTVCPRLRKLGILKDGYSLDFEDWMKDVCSFLVNTLSNVSYAYTQSDEITLLFSPTTFNEKSQTFEPHVYNGRRDKLLTLCASLATQRFHRHMVLQGGLDLMDSLPHAVFDARLGVYASLADAFELVLWRSYDCSVNAVSTTLHLDPVTVTADGTPLSRKEVGTMNTVQKLVLLYEAGRMAGMTHHQRYGTLLHRQRQPCEVTNRLTGDTEIKDKYCVEQVEGLIVNSVKEGKIVLSWWVSVTCCGCILSQPTSFPWTACVAWFICIFVCMAVKKSVEKCKIVLYIVT